MNLKAKRLVRTPYSEQYALFDLDRTDSDYNPLSMGKLDLHYTEQGIYGTLLFWQDAAVGLAWDHIVRWAEALLSEFNEPMGVPAEYAIEFFSPSLQQYQLLSNISAEPADAALNAVDNGAESGHQESAGSEPENSTGDDEEGPAADWPIEKRRRVEIG